MHDMLVSVVVDQIHIQFGDEKNFCEHYLNCPEEMWQAWKQGKQKLPKEMMERVKHLFSDYEWMLLQKVLRQAMMMPETRPYVVVAYKRMKAIIANHWLHSGLATLEMITYDNQRDDHRYQRLVRLKVTIAYNEWGFDDILEFYLPAQIQEQIENTSVGLLEWVHDNLEQTYVVKDKDYE